MCNQACSALTQTVNSINTMKLNHVRRMPRTIAAVSIGPQRVCSAGKIYKKNCRLRSVVILCKKTFISVFMNRLKRSVAISEFLLKQFDLAVRIFFAQFSVDDQLLIEGDLITPIVFNVIQGLVGPIHDGHW